jgi:hypothetical protein
MKQYDCPLCNGRLRCTPNKMPHGWTIWCTHCGAWATFDEYWILLSSRSGQSREESDKLRTVVRTMRTSLKDQ